MNKTRGSHSIKRFLATFVAQVFVLQQVAFAAPTLNISQIFNSHTPAHKFVQIPSSIASVEDVFDAANSKGTWVLLQDAHTNPTGQYNIAKALNNILEQQDIDYVFTEAGNGDESLRYFHRFGNPKRVKEVADSYVNKGILQGAQYLSMTGEREFTLWGVENQNLYNETLTTYRNIAENRTENTLFINRLRRASQALKERLYNRDLLAFDRDYTRSQSDEITATEYIQILFDFAHKNNVSTVEFKALQDIRKVISMENKLDFDQAGKEQLKSIQELPVDKQNVLIESQKTNTYAPHEVKNVDERYEQSYYSLLHDFLSEHVQKKGSSIKASYPALAAYFEYLNAFKGLDVSRVIEEQASLEIAIFDALAKSEKEIRLVQVSRNVELLQKLFDLRITPSEFNVLVTEWDSFNIARLAGFMNREFALMDANYEKVVFLEENYVDQLQKAINFYQLTYKRDIVFVQRTIAKLQELGQKNTVLITGGYHAENLKAMLKDRGISYVSVIPNILYETDHERYEQILLSQEKSAIKGAQYAKNNADKQLFYTAMHRQAREYLLGTVTLASRMAREAGLDTTIPEVARGIAGAPSDDVDASRLAFYQKSKKALEDRLIGSGLTAEGASERFGGHSTRRLYRHIWQNYLKRGKDFDVVIYGDEGAFSVVDVETHYELEINALESKLRELGEIVLSSQNTMGFGDGDVRGFLSLQKALDAYSGESWELYRKVRSFLFHNSFQIEYTPAYTDVTYTGNTTGGLEDVAGWIPGEGRPATFDITLAEVTEDSAGELDSGASRLAFYKKTKEALEERLRGTGVTVEGAAKLFGGPETQLLHHIWWNYIRTDRDFDVIIRDDITYFSVVDVEEHYSREIKLLKQKLDGLGRVLVYEQADDAVALGFANSRKLTLEDVIRFYPQGSWHLYRKIRSINEGGDIAIAYDPNPSHVTDAGAGVAGTTWTYDSKTSDTQPLSATFDVLPASRLVVASRLAQWPKEVLLDVGNTGVRFERMSDAARGWNVSFLQARSGDVSSVKARFKANKDIEDYRTYHVLSDKIGKNELFVMVGADKEGNFVDAGFITTNDFNKKARRDPELKNVFRFLSSHLDSNSKDIDDYRDVFVPEFSFGAINATELEETAHKKKLASDYGFTYAVFDDLYGEAPKWTTASLGEYTKKVISRFPLDSFIWSLGYEPIPMKFGTSGLRGLAKELTDVEVYINTRGFLRYLASFDVKPGSAIPVGGDFRDSTDRIMKAVAQAIRDEGFEPSYQGRVPTPTLANYAFHRNQPSVMVTGSHIPADRNGIKFQASNREVLKTDEEGIYKFVAEVRQEVYSQNAESSRFNSRGLFKESPELPGEDKTARNEYVKRYLDVFPKDLLQGKKVVIYQHSSIGRDVMVEIFEGLGANVVSVGRTNDFTAIDTEKVTDGEKAYFKQISEAHPDAFAILSMDSDADRPILVDENGDFHRGDVLGYVAALSLGADSLSFPESSSDAIELAIERDGGSFRLERTRIGSPYVIASMDRALTEGRKTPVSWEVNGGFLTGAPIDIYGNTLAPLPTRDAILPLILALKTAVDANQPVSKAFNDLPQRYTSSDSIEGFANERSARVIDEFTPNVPAQLGDIAVLEAQFNGNNVDLTYMDSTTRIETESPDSSIVPIGVLEPIKALAEQMFEGFGQVASIRYKDGIKIRFDNGDVAHLRPSSNAPEFRVYAISNSPERAEEIVKLAVKEPDGIMRKIEKHFYPDGSRLSIDIEDLTNSKVIEYEGRYVTTLQNPRNLMNSHDEGFGPEAGIWLGTHQRDAALIAVYQIQDAKESKVLVAFNDDGSVKSIYLKSSQDDNSGLLYRLEKGLQALKSTSDFLARKIPAGSRFSAFDEILRAGELDNGRRFILTVHRLPNAPVLGFSLHADQPEYNVYPSIKWVAANQSDIHTMPNALIRKIQELEKTSVTNTTLGMAINDLDFNKPSEQLMDWAVSDYIDSIEDPTSYSDHYLPEERYSEDFSGLVPVKKLVLERLADLKQSRIDPYHQFAFVRGEEAYFAALFGMDNMEMVKTFNRISAKAEFDFALGYTRDRGKFVVRAIPGGDENLSLSIIKRGANPSDDQDMGKIIIVAPKGKKDVEVAQTIVNHLQSTQEITSESLGSAIDAVGYERVAADASRFAGIDELRGLYPTEVAALEGKLRELGEVVIEQYTQMPLVRQPKRGELTLSYVLHLYNDQPQRLFEEIRDIRSSGHDFDIDHTPKVITDMTVNPVSIKPFPDSLEETASQPATFDVVYASRLSNATQLLTKANAWWQKATRLSLDGTTDLSNAWHAVARSLGAVKVTWNPFSLGKFVLGGGLDHKLGDLTEEETEDPTIALKRLTEIHAATELPNQEVSIELDPTVASVFEFTVKDDGSFEYIEPQPGFYSVKPEYREILQTDRWQKVDETGGSVPFSRDQSLQISNLMKLKWVEQAIDIHRLGSQNRGDKGQNNAVVKIGNTQDLGQWMGDYGRNVGADVLHALSVLDISRNFTLGFTPSDADLAIEKNRVTRTENILAEGFMQGYIFAENLTEGYAYTSTEIAWIVLQNLDANRVKINDDIKNGNFIDQTKDRQSRFYHSHFASRWDGLLSKDEWKDVLGIDPIGQQAHPWFGVVTTMYTLLTRFNSFLPEVQEDNRSAIPASLAPKVKGQPNYIYLAHLIGFGQSVTITAPQAVYDALNDLGLSEEQLEDLVKLTQIMMQDYADELDQVAKDPKNPTEQERRRAAITAMSKRLGDSTNYNGFQSIGDEAKARQIVTRILDVYTDDSRGNVKDVLAHKLYIAGAQVFLTPQFQAEQAVKEALDGSRAAVGSNDRIYLNMSYYRQRMQEFGRQYIRDQIEQRYRRLEGIRSAIRKIEAALDEEGLLTGTNREETELQLSLRQQELDRVNGEIENLDSLLAESTTDASRLSNATQLLTKANAWWQKATRLSLDGTTDLSNAWHAVARSLGAVKVTWNPFSLGKFVLGGGLDHKLGDLTEEETEDPTIALKRLTEIHAATELPNQEVSIELDPTVASVFEFTVKDDGSFEYIEPQPGFYSVKPEYREIIGNHIWARSQELPDDKAFAIRNLMVAKWVEQAIDIHRLGSQNRGDKGQNNAVVKIGNTQDLGQWMGDYGRNVGADVLHALSVLDISRNFTLGFTPSDADLAIRKNRVTEVEAKTLAPYRNSIDGSEDLSPTSKLIAEKIVDWINDNERLINDDIAQGNFIDQTKDRQSRFYHSHFASRWDGLLSKDEWKDVLGIDPIGQQAHPWFGVVTTMYTLLTRFNSFLPEVQEDNRSAIPASLAPKVKGQPNYIYLAHLIGFGQSVTITAPQAVYDALNDLGLSEEQLEDLVKLTQIMMQDYADELDQVAKDPKNPTEQERRRAAITAMSKRLGDSTNYNGFQSIGDEAKARQIVTRILVYYTNPAPDASVLVAAEKLYIAGAQVFLTPQFQAEQAVKEALEGARFSQDQVAEVQGKTRDGNPFSVYLISEQESEKEVRVEVLGSLDDGKDSVSLSPVWIRVGQTMTYQDAADLIAKALSAFDELNEKTFSKAMRATNLLIVEQPVGASRLTSYRYEYSWDQISSYGISAGLLNRLQSHIKTDPGTLFVSEVLESTSLRSDLQISLIDNQHLEIVYPETDGGGFNRIAIDTHKWTQAMISSEELESLQGRDDDGAAMARYALAWTRFADNALNYYSRASYIYGGQPFTIGSYVFSTSKGLIALAPERGQDDRDFARFQVYDLSQGDTGIEEISRVTSVDAKVYVDVPVIAEESRLSETLLFDAKRPIVFGKTNLEGQDIVLEFEEISSIQGLLDAQQILQRQLQLQPIALSQENRSLSVDTGVVNRWSRESGQRSRGRDRSIRTRHLEQRRHTSASRFSFDPAYIVQVGGNADLDTALNARLIFQGVLNQDDTRFEQLALRDILALEQEQEVVEFFAYPQGADSSSTNPIQVFIATSPSEDGAVITSSYVHVPGAVSDPELSDLHSQLTDALNDPQIYQGSVIDQTEFEQAAIRYFGFGQEEVISASRFALNLNSKNFRSLLTDIGINEAYLSKVALVTTSLRGVDLGDFQVNSHREVEVSLKGIRYVKYDPSSNELAIQFSNSEVENQVPITILTISNFSQALGVTRVGQVKPENIAIGIKRALDAVLVGNELAEKPTTVTLPVKKKGVPATNRSKSASFTIDPIVFGVEVDSDDSKAIRFGIVGEAIEGSEDSASPLRIRLYDTRTDQELGIAEINYGVIGKKGNRRVVLADNNDNDPSFATSVHPVAVALAPFRDLRGSIFEAHEMPVYSQLKDELERTLTSVLTNTQVGEAQTGFGIEGTQGTRLSAIDELSALSAEQYRKLTVEQLEEVARTDQYPSEETLEVLKLLAVKAIDAQRGRVGQLLPFVPHAGQDPYLLRLDVTFDGLKIEVVGVDDFIITNEEVTALRNSSSDNKSVQRADNMVAFMDAVDESHTQMRGLFKFVFESLPAGPAEIVEDKYIDVRNFRDTTTGKYNLSVVRSSLRYFVNYQKREHAQNVRFVFPNLDSAPDKVRSLIQAEIERNQGVLGTLDDARPGVHKSVLTLPDGKGIEIDGAAHFAIQPIKSEDDKVSVLDFERYLGLPTVFIHIVDSTAHQAVGSFTMDDVTTAFTHFHDAYMTRVEPGTDAYEALRSMETFLGKIQDGTFTFAEALPPLGFSSIDEEMQMYDYMMLYLYTSV